MKKLYEIEAELILYVMAEDENEAKSVAMRNVQEECKNLQEFDLSVVRPSALFANWQNEYPYNSDDNNTVKEIFEREEKARKIKEKDEKEQMKLFKEKPWSSP